jgi:hypothetical protein
MLSTAAPIQHLTRDYRRMLIYAGPGRSVEIPRNWVAVDKGENCIGLKDESYHATRKRFIFAVATGGDKIFSVRSSLRRPSGSAYYSVASQQIYQIGCTSSIKKEQSQTLHIIVW